MLKHNANNPLGCNPKCISCFKVSLNNISNKYKNKKPIIVGKKVKINN